MLYLEILCRATSILFEIGSFTIKGLDDVFSMRFAWNVLIYLLLWFMIKLKEQIACYLLWKNMDIQQSGDGSIRSQLLFFNWEKQPVCLRCSFWWSSALEFLSTCKLTNLTVKAELGCCLLHRSGRLIIDECILQCESNPLDYLSCPIVSTAGSGVFPSNLKSDGDSISVSHTRIEGGAKAVLTSGDLALQQVRVIYARTCLYFWFDVDCR